MFVSYAALFSKQNLFKKILAEEGSDIMMFIECIFSSLSGNLQLLKLTGL